MKNEFEERLILQEEISDQVIKRLEAVEKRDYPDYEQATSEMKIAVEAVGTQVSTVKTIVENLPPSISLRHEYALDLKTRGWLIGFVAFVILFLVICSLYISTLRENHRLRADDLKYRAIRQVFPIQTDWADSLYYADPEHMENITDSLEEAAKVRSHTKDIAEQSAREAREAKARFDGLKGKINKKGK